MNLNASDLLPQSRSHVGRYRLVARLGAGGMADVYLAMASGMVGFTKLSVVKVLKPEQSHDNEHVAMFLNEARLAARLNHPNVVQTNEVGEDQGFYYLVMEYLEGQTLRRVLQLGNGDAGRRLPVFLRCISDMLAGLHYAHELCDFDGTPLGVVHRDVSPHNVFVTYDGQTKVVDFGIAKVVGSSHLTRTGILKGKVSYMAPEQARGRSVDRRADIFSAGVILWEVLTGKRLWGGEGDFAILQRLASGELPAIRQEAPNAPEGLLQICERALAFDPAARFATAQEMREAIDAFVDGSGWRVTSSDLSSLMTSSFREQRSAIQSVIESAMAVGSGAHPLPWLAGTGVTHPEHDAFSHSGSRLGQMRSADSASIASNFHLSTGVSRPAPLRRSILPWALTGLVVALASGGGVFWALQRRAEPVALSPVVAPTASPAAAAAPAAPELAELQVRVSPVNATIYLDGKEQKGNPFRGSFSRDSLHELRAEAPGYQPATQTITVQRDIIVDLSLIKQPPPPSPPAVARPAPQPAAARSRTQPARPSGQPTGPSESNFELPQPPAGKRPVQTIDPESPYLTAGRAHRSPPRRSLTKTKPPEQAMRFPSFFVKGPANVTLSLASVACSLWVSSCSAIVENATDYCSSTSDCTRRGEAYANSVCRDSLCQQVQSSTPPGGADWSCVGSVAYKPAQQTPSATVTVRLIDPFTSGPIPGLLVRPCGRVDATCTNPLLPDWLTTDAFGAVRVPVPTNQATQGVPGFTGYFEIKSMTGSHVPYLYFLNPPVIADRETTFPIGTPEQAQAFYAGLMGFMPMPDRGTGAIVAKDCKGAPAADVRLEIPEADANLNVFYIEGVAPSPNAKKTSASGLAFLFNAPNGTATINIIRDDTNEVTSRVSVLFRPGHSTFVEMDPTPL